MGFTEIFGELEYVMDIKTGLQIIDLEWVVREEVGTIFDIKTRTFGHGTETATVFKTIQTPEEIADEQLWDKQFTSSQDALARLADEALAEFRQGKTQELDPDKL